MVLLVGDVDALQAVDVPGQAALGDERLARLDRLGKRVVDEDVLLLSLQEGGKGGGCESKVSRLLWQKYSKKAKRKEGGKLNSKKSLALIKILQKDAINLVQKSRI